MEGGGVHLQAGEKVAEGDSLLKLIPSPSASEVIRLGLHFSNSYTQWEGPGWR